MSIFGTHVLHRIVLSLAHMCGLELRQILAAKCRFLRQPVDDIDEFLYGPIEHE